MNRRRILEVDLDGYGSLVRGHGSREVVEAITGRPPVWNRTARGWSVQESTARDVIAAAEVRGYDVLIAGPRGVQHRTPVADETPVPNETPAIPAAPVEPGLFSW